MKNLVLCLGVLLSVITVSAQHVPKSLTASNGQFIGFYQYTPTNYNSSTKYPLIISLHGIGERGNGTTDLKNVLGLGVAGAIEGGHNMTFTWNGKTETFLVLSPQLDTKYGSWQNFYVEEMISYAKKNLNIDENRIFLTGLSLGGGGVWSYSGASVDNAKKLAAIGVCCGTCQSLNWCNYASANLPVWAFHSTDDGTVGVGCTTGAIANINKCTPAVKPYMTIWPDGNHWIWGRVYSTDYSYQNPNLYEWFLGQDKSKPVNKRPVAEAGSTLSILNAVGVVTLDASKSTDVDGKIVRSIWRKISGPSYGSITAAVSVNGITTVTGLTAAGTYQYELKVIDDRADWTLDTVTVTVGIGGTPNKVPTANAGADVTITLPEASVTLTGTGADSDGSITGYSWTKSSGPTAGTITSSTAAKTTVTGLTAGTYVFKLTVTDNTGAIGADEVTVVVKAAASDKPTGPTSNAGADATITLPTSSVALDGSASAEPYGSTFKAYKWWKKSGPTAGTITNATALTTTVTGLAEGTYVFTLTVWDSQWVPYDDTKTIVVNPVVTSPDNGTGGGGGGGTDNPVTTSVANAGADFSITLPTSNGTLNGSASSDPKGVIKAYKWAQISGPNTGTIAASTSATSAVSGLVQGTYYFKLTAWDNAWLPWNDTVKVTVNPAASTGGGTVTGRIANAGADFAISLPTTTATLNGSASSDPKGAIKAYTWNQISGPNTSKIASTTAATTAVSGLVQGTYAFRLTVWDNAWVPGSDTVILVVKPGTSSSNSTVDDGSPAPGSVSNAGADITIYTPSTSVTLDGSASADANGGIIKAWSWTKISGPEQHNIANASVSTTTVSNLVEGTYQFRLVVWDNVWMPYADTVNVYVVSQSVIARSTTAAVTTTENARSTTTTAAASAYSEQVLLYPNPVASTTLNVQTTSSNTGASVVNVYDLAGRLVQKTAFQKSSVLHQQALNVSKLAPGVYSIEVVIDNTKRFNSKFVKQ